MKYLCTQLQYFHILFEFQTNAQISADLNNIHRSFAQCAQIRFIATTTHTDDNCIISALTSRSVNVYANSGHQSQAEWDEKHLKMKVKEE